jgi:hypothetical protein
MYRLLIGCLTSLLLASSAFASDHAKDNAYRQCILADKGDCSKLDASNKGKNLTQTKKPTSGMGVTTGGARRH